MTPILTNAMQFLGLYFSKTHIRDKLLCRQTLSVYFSILGGMWLLARLVSMNQSAETFIEEHISFYYMLIAGMILTLVDRRPELTITKKVCGLDVIINIRVGNLMVMKDSCVVPTNTTFDTKLYEIIAEESLQGQFTTEYYDDSSHLDVDMAGALRETEYKDLSREKGRSGKTRRYPTGTVIKVKPRSRTFYLLAMADINREGNAVSDFKMIQTSLYGLWTFLAKSGNYETELLMPIIGTGRGRVVQSREKIICEIVDSFIEASAQRRVCDSLSIVIHPRDFYKFSLKIEDLKNYLYAQCNYPRNRRLLPNIADEV